MQVSHELQEAVLSLQQMMRETSETDDMINSISLDAMLAKLCGGGVV